MPDKATTDKSLSGSNPQVRQAAKNVKVGLVGGALRNITEHRGVAEGDVSKIHDGDSCAVSNNV